MKALDESLENLEKIITRDKDRRVGARKKKSHSSKL
jgi:hypothetical protein